MKNFKKWPRTLLPWILLLAAANTALALEDGGGRSVFARGAGERALALGGAYGALTADASALVWNPAGLARIPRKSLYASHSGLVGLGFTEQAGLLALPSWRLGTFSIGLRRFGVDGIEGRDDRGGIVAENLKDAETEILAGYGRNLGEAWDVGLTFKYRNHELAGYSDGAPGLDLGLMVRPLRALGSRSPAADRLNLGLTARNIIEPSIRLDEEAVADPTGFRGGLSFGGPLGSGLHYCLAGGVEKTRDMDTHLHLGAEATVMDVLSLRLGSNAGMMTAGAGFHVRGLNCDYAFEDNPIETVHRFGLGLAFGPTTEEARQADLAAEEQALRQRLAKAFEDRNSERLRHFLDEARGCLERGENEEALRHIETVRVLDPQHAGLDDLQAAAHYGQAQVAEQTDDLSGARIAYERVLILDPEFRDAAARLQEVQTRANDQADRTARLRQHFDTALALYARGNLIETRNELQTLLSLDPDDKEAAALLRATNVTLNMRAESFIEQALAHTEAHHFPEARQALEEAAALDPEHPDLARAERLLSDTIASEQKRQELASRQARQSAKPADAATKPAVPRPEPEPKQAGFADLAPHEQAEVEDLYRRGLQAGENGRHHDAIRYWEIVWDRAPDFQGVAENLKQEYLAQGMEEFAAGQLEQSIRFWEKARTIDPQDARTRGYLARAYEHRARIAEIKGNGK